MGKDYLQILKDRQKKTESEKLARQQEYERKQYLSKTKEDLKDGSVIVWVSFRNFSVSSETLAKNALQDDSDAVAEVPDIPSVLPLRLPSPPRRAPQPPPRKIAAPPPGRIFAPKATKAITAPPPGRLFAAKRPAPSPEKLAIEAPQVSVAVKKEIPELISEVDR